MNKYLVTLAALVAFAATQAPAEAHGWFGVGINIGVPCYRPYCGPYYYPYYRPYYYVAPAPVYVAPSPVVLDGPPPPPPGYAPAPVVRSAAPPAAGESIAAPRPADARGPDMSRQMQMLNDPDERVRSDAALDLGRAKAQNAVDSLCSMLASDKSSLVRETAARALGLIGSPRSLSALQTSAQVDNDRDVRRSAQFSAEVIRANLR